ncbi:hypothetical protein J2T09_004895 [Neorhizobium huautlense]|uniref:Helix-turn-helix domain-containing protein n=1 Tax=Neorhizobium huautlense TaxID=67774 RepID=A0ABT9Q058_9HYPH|nr:hypothetical protein [Neorhizobium huautlense]MDP9840115.1 hypothetical protein [Neorhizobium huautlense]
MEKFERSERNYLIAVLKLAGEPSAVTAARFGISAQHASNIARGNTWMVEARAGRPVPAGLTTRAAVAIEQTLGIWPSNANKAFVEGSAMTLLRSENGRRVIMEDIGRWLKLKHGLHEDAPGRRVDE